MNKDAAYDKIVFSSTSDEDALPRRNVPVSPPA